MCNNIEVVRRGSLKENHVHPGVSIRVVRRVKQHGPAHLVAVGGALDHGVTRGVFKHAGQLEGVAPAHLWQRRGQAVELLAITIPAEWVRVKPVMGSQSTERQ